MIKKTMIATGIALAITTTLTANIAVAEEAASWTDDFEVSGEIKNETAVFTKAGTTIGAATAHKSKDIMKSESSARIFINGPVAEGVEMHAELRPVRDGQAVDGYKGAKSYSQHDLLRELYVDTEVGNEDSPVSLRIGKQQVVWGTADGIKLLDIINPTDWREFAQNTMDESRIPVWMVNAETDLENGANVQFILSQAEENKIPGLNASGDQGHPFIMKGVDSITGKTNGMLNIAPAMGQVARFFSVAGGGQLGSYTHATVSEFVNNQGVGAYDALNKINDGVVGDAVASVLGSDAGDFFGLCGQVANGTANTGSAGCLSDLANNTNTIVTGVGNVTKGSNDDVTNLIQVAGADYVESNPDTVFEYMGQATFATFETFTNMVSDYKVDRDSNDGNVGFRYKSMTDSGINWSFNYMNHEDANPYVTIHWEDQNGVGLTPAYTNMALGATTTLFDGDGDSANETNNNAATTTVTLQRNGAAITPAGRGDGTNTGAAAGDTAHLVFTERSNRINSFGSSFDMSVDTDFSPVVLRGEFLYDKDVKVPVVDRAALSIGDVEKALSNEDADFFKYVLGADVTVMTNLMLSGQFIQFRNLDYIDETGRAPTRGGITSNVTGARYTGDAATLHLSNGLQKAEENKEFYSFFMSKPFGAEQQHRWNNIFMFEENGGKWNRFDVEYSFNDELIGMAEMNKYWGDTNTQFGQMENSSNLQLGLKYIF